MIGLAPMPLVDDFLIPYHIGHALALLFVLVIPAGIIKKSPKIVGINSMLFGGLFLLVPGIEPGASLAYSLFGIGLLVVGPLAFAIGSE